MRPRACATGCRRIQRCRWAPAACLWGAPPPANSPPLLPPTWRRHHLRADCLWAGAGRGAAGRLRGRGAGARRRRGVQSRAGPTSSPPPPHSSNSHPPCRPSPGAHRILPLLLPRRGGLCGAGQGAGAAAGAPRGRGADRGHALPGCGSCMAGPLRGLPSPLERRLAPDSAPNAPRCRGSGRRHHDRGALAPHPRPDLHRQEVSWARLKGSRGGCFPGRCSRVAGLGVPAPGLQPATHPCCIAAAAPSTPARAALRPCPGRRARAEAERKAINSTIQGSAADIVKVRRGGCLVGLMGDSGLNAACKAAAAGDAASSPNCFNPAWFRCRPRCSAGAAGTRRSRARPAASWRRWAAGCCAGVGRCLRAPVPLHTGAACALVARQHTGQPTCTHSFNPTHPPSPPTLTTNIHPAQIHDELILEVDASRVDAAWVARVSAPARPHGCCPLSAVPHGPSRCRRPCWLRPHQLDRASAVDRRSCGA